MVRYYSAYRPIGIGCYPKPPMNRVIKISNFDDRIVVDDFGKPVLGYIEYEKPLDESEACSYELEEAGYHYWYEVQFKVDKEDATRILAARVSGWTWAKERPKKRIAELKRFNVVSVHYFDKKYAEKCASELTMKCD